MKYFLEIENVTGKKMTCVCKQNKANYRIGHAFRHLSILYLLLSIVANLEKFQKINRIKNTLHNIMSCPQKVTLKNPESYFWHISIKWLSWALKYHTRFFLCWIINPDRVRYWIFTFFLMLSSSISYRKSGDE